MSGNRSLDRSSDALRSQAEEFRKLHVPGKPVVLPNVWDAASAKVVAAAGFTAIATSSGAIAETLGFEDHEGTPATEMFAAIARIATVADVPVTADLEAGYGLSATEFVERMLNAGAVGCNLEDTDHAAGGLVPAATAADRLAAVRAAADKAGIPIVINARIDTWMHPGSAGDRYADAIERARRYRDAGAECVYPIFLTDLDAITRFVREADAPVNILRTASGPPVPALIDAGVARISYGTALFRQQQQRWQDLVSELAEPIRRTA